MPPVEKTSSSSYVMSEYIKSLIELTTRVDERVQLMMGKVQDLEEKVDAQFDTLNELNAKVKVLESQNHGKSLPDQLSGIKDNLHKLELKIQAIENSNNTQENRWKTIVGFAIQLIWVVLAAWLLYKLGIQAPAVP